MLIYLGGALSGTGLQLLGSGRYDRLLGASGAICAVMAAWICKRPNEEIYLYGAVRMPSWVYGIGYLGYSTYMSYQEGNSVAHLCHIGGALFGGLFYLLHKKFGRGRYTLRLL